MAKETSTNSRLKPGTASSDILGVMLRYTRWEGCCMSSMKSVSTAINHSSLMDGCSKDTERKPERGEGMFLILLLSFEQHQQLG